MITRHCHIIASVSSRLQVEFNIHCHRHHLSVSLSRIVFKVRCTRIVLCVLLDAILLQCILNVFQSVMFLIYNVNALLSFSLFFSFLFICSSKFERMREMHFTITDANNLRLKFSVYFACFHRLKFFSLLSHAIPIQPPNMPGKPGIHS